MASATNTSGIRGTQSFVKTIARCWSQPSLIALEVAWRWLFGIPALVVVWSQVKGVLAAATAGTMDPASLGLDPVLLRDLVGALSADPLGAAGKLSHALSLVWPGLVRVGAWLLPLLLAGWIFVSSLGRSLVIRRANPLLKTRPATLMGLQTIRLGILCAAFWAWFAGVRWASTVAVTQPIGRGEEPNLVLYCGLVIVLSLGCFTGWGFISWPLSLAPVLAMSRDCGVFTSLGAALRAREVRGRLVEVNLVMGIVKIALIVLAMVFSASPLPFESVTSPEFLRWWWIGVGIFYLVASDFFHVARLLSYLEMGQP